MGQSHIGCSDFPPSISYCFLDMHPFLGLFGMDSGNHRLFRRVASDVSSMRLGEYGLGISNPVYVHGVGIAGRLLVDQWTPGNIF
jgi:hypothetical protein